MNKQVIYFTIVTFILAIVISPFASSSPDGLERVAHDLGFIDFENEPLYSIFPDYSISIISFEFLSTAISGLIGLVIIGLLTYLWIIWAKRKTYN